MGRSSGGCRQRELHLSILISPDAPFANYSPLSDRFDECVDASGVTRQAWRPLVDAINAMGRDAFESMVADGAALARESGATYNAVEEEGERTRPWELTFIPLVIQAGEWKALDTALKQRVRILEAVLDDLLGDQRLIKERVLPAELLMNNPEYHHGYRGLPKVGGVRLHVTATDLARDTDGSWWITGDRTRAPSGLGYLVENRIVTSRAYPHLIQQSNIHRIAAFFLRLRQMFESLAPRAASANPRVAILTPGQKSYRYFEDTYLARYLGYTLVQGRDLAVRNGMLNLKTLGGLLPIDVLWRHISDEQCDPLELDPGAIEGVTGLLQTLRCGNVAIANSLGSKLSQSPSLLPFLPAAARFLLSEEPLLPHVATYWCGQEAERKFVLDHLDSLTIRPAFTVRGDRPIEPAEMSKQARSQLIEAIRARPENYVAQAPVPRSTTPVWHGGKMQSWYVALRSFQIQSAGVTDVLPGGMVRVSPTAGGIDYAHGAVQLGQDCWVVADGLVDTTSTLLPPPHLSLKLVRGGAELPSRVAENLFWMGRYSERAEAIARLLRTTLVRLTGEQSVSSIPEMPRLIAALAAIGQIEPDYAVEGLKKALPKLDDALPQSLYTIDQRRGLLPSLTAMVDQATAVRDRISLDAYRIVRRAEEDLTQPVQRGGRADSRFAINRLTRLITDLLAFAGLCQESITRTLGWRFLMVGRRIERACQTAELLRATLVSVSMNASPIDPGPMSPSTNTLGPTPPAAKAEGREENLSEKGDPKTVSQPSDERPILEAVLEATDSIMTYRSRYLLRLEPAATLDLLITDDSNPRSILFQLERIVEVMQPLPTEADEVGTPIDRRLAMELLHRVRMADPTDLASTTPSGERANLDQLLEYLTDNLPELSNAISARYLIHTFASQSLTGQVPS